MEEITKLTAEEITELLTAKNVKETTIDGLNFVRSEVPPMGTFAKVDVVDAEIPTENGVNKVTYPVLIVVDSEKNKIGQVAFSRIFAGTCIPLEDNDYSKGVKCFQIKKAGANVNKWMPTTKRLNNLVKFGSKDTQIISSLIGKDYVATVKGDCVVPDLNNLNHIQTTEARAKKATTLKDLHLFNIE